MSKLKKFISILLLGAITLSSVGCSKQNIAENKEQSVQSQEVNKDKDQGEQSEEKKSIPMTVNVKSKVDNKKIGVAFDIPEAWRNYALTNLFSKGIYPKNQSEDDAIFGASAYYFTPEDIFKDFKGSKKQEEDYKKVTDNSKLLAEMTVFNKSNLERELNNGKKLEDFMKGDNIEKLGEEGEYAFYFSCNEMNDDGLKGEEKDGYKETHSQIEDMRKSIKISEPYKFNLGYIGDFKTKDLQGNSIDTTIFEDYKLTMVNIWSTGCNPCIREMPELEELYQEMKDKGVNIVGLVADGDNEKKKENIDKIIDMTDVTYTNIKPDEVLKKGILSQVIGLPTTIFFDSKGNVVGKEVVGAASKEDYKKAIEERLESIK